VISGKKLDAKAIDVVVDGRLVRLCCPDCKSGLEKDKAAAFAKIDAGVIAAQKASYPLTTCPISGEKLGGMGEPVNVVQGTKLVKLCCNNCKKGLEKDPAAALAKVDKAWIDAQLPSYGLETCPVSGEKLGGMGEPVNVLYGTKLVRLCCSSCKKALDKDGPAIVAKVDAAKKK
jgi:type II secretory ATPase GspE/PulE/Tfp pilus assembly ATPase PilB-like protein